MIKKTKNNPLFDNPLKEGAILETILFLIIVGILSSIFGKAKGKPNPGRTKPFTAKRFDDFRTMVEQQMGAFRKNPDKSQRVRL